MSIDANIATLVAAVGGVAGVKRAHANPPESFSQFPAAIVYVVDGSFGEPTGRTICEAHTVTYVVELYTARQVLPQAIAAARKWPEPVIAALRATALNIRYPLNWTMGPLPYSAETLFGLRFRISIKE